MAKGRSISKISKELETLVEKMKKMAKEYAEADGVKKQKLMASLKDLTKDKKQLEKELESSVNELDKDAQLQIDEIRKLIRNIIIKEIKKKSLNEIEFNSSKTTSASKKTVELDDVELSSEDEKNTDNALDKVFAGLEKVLISSKSDIKKAATNEDIGVALGLIAALPKIIDFIGKLIKGGPRMLSILMGQGQMYGTMEKAEQLAIKLGAKIEHGGHALHTKYINGIKKLARVLDPSFKSMPEELQDKFAEMIWMAVVASLLITSGIGTVHSALDAHFGHAAVEGVLSAIKRNELAAFLEAEFAALTKA